MSKMALIWMLWRRSVSVVQGHKTLKLNLIRALWWRSVGVVRGPPALPGLLPELLAEAPGACCPSLRFWSLVQL